MSSEPLRLYTGKMGHGKTLRAVYDLYHEIVLDEKKPIDKQRHFYANIDGLQIDGVKQPPDDWREVPNGSLIIYDEADLIDYYKASNNKNLSDVVRETKLARKRDIHIWFIVQHPNQLNVFIRRIIGEHIHARRPLGAEMTKLYYFPDVCDDPTDFLKQKKAEKTKLFHFPKDLYGIYDSADSGSNHRQKWRLPESYVKGIFFFLFLVIGAIVLAMSSCSEQQEQFQQLEQKQEVKQKQQDIDKKLGDNQQALTFDIKSTEQQPIDSTEQEQTTIEKTQQPILQSTYLSEPVIGSVMMMKGVCRAYTHDGMYLPDVSHSECVKRINNVGMVVKRNLTMPY